MKYDECSPVTQRIITAFIQQALVAGDRHSERVKNWREMAAIVEREFKAELAAQKQMGNTPTAGEVKR